MISSIILIHQFWYRPNTYTYTYGSYTCILIIANNYKIKRYLFDLLKSIGYRNTLNRQQLTVLINKIGSFLTHGI